MFLGISATKNQEDDPKKTENGYHLVKLRLFPGWPSSLVKTSFAAVPFTSVRHRFNLGKAGKRAAYQWLDMVATYELYKADKRLGMQPHPYKIYKALGFTVIPHIYT